MQRSYLSSSSGPAKLTPSGVRAAAAALETREQALQDWQQRWEAHTGALAAAERGLANLPGSPPSIGVLAALLRDHDPARSAALLASIEETRYGTAIGRVLYYLIAGDVERAAAAVNAALDEQYHATLIFLRLPIAAPLRASPRWPALVARMRLPDATG